MITTDAIYKQQAIQQGREDIDLRVTVGDHVIHADRDGGLISVRYNYDTDSAVGSFALAQVKLEFYITNPEFESFNYFQSNVIRINQRFEGSGYVSLGPFYMVDDGYEVSQEGVVTITALDKGQFADIPFTGIAFPGIGLTGKQILDNLLDQCGLTLDPGSPSLPFDSRRFTSINAGYSTDLGIRTLLSQYAQINSASIIINNSGDVVFKPYKTTPDLEIDGFLYADWLYEGAVGPINALVATNSASGDPYQGIRVEDAASIAEFGETEFKVDNNRFVDFDPNNMIIEMFPNINGLTTHKASISGYKARLDLEPLDVVEFISPVFDESYVVTITNIEWVYAGDLSGTLKCVGVPETLTEYSIQSLATEIRNVKIMANDQEGRITAEVRRIDQEIENIELTPGPQGPAGSDGTSQYVFIRYSANANGSGMTVVPNTATKYIGTAVTTTNTAPSNASAYTWALFKGADGDTGPKGDQGIPGTPGKDGQPTYTWIKYADTPTSGMSNYAEGKKYIGLAFNKSSPTQSTNYADYQWSLMPQNITIGGKNYLYNTELLMGVGGLQYWLTAAPGLTRENIPGFGYVHKSSQSGLNQDSWRGPVQLIPIERFPRLKVGDVLTVSWFVNVVSPATAFQDRDISLQFFERDSNGRIPGGGTYHTINNANILSGKYTDQWNRISIQHVIKNDSIVDFECRIYVTRNGTALFGKAQVEIGNTLSDYNPAPEDIQNEVIRVETETKASLEINEQAIELEKLSRTTEYGTLYDSISETQGQLSLTDTALQIEIADRKKQNEDILEQTSTLINQTSESIRLEVTKTQEQVDGLNVDMTIVKTYFDFAEELTVGKSDSPYKAIFGNESLQFTENGQVQTEISRQQLITERIVVRQSATLGNHIIEKSPYNADRTLWRGVNL